MQGCKGGAGGAYASGLQPYLCAWLAVLCVLVQHLLGHCICVVVSLPPPPQCVAEVNRVLRRYEENEGMHAVRQGLVINCAQPLTSSTRAGLGHS